ncbi:MAG: ATP-binding cassette domain-containing protein [Nitriliruptor sp.]
MIDLDRVTVTYDGASEPSLTDLTLHVPEGELCLVVGPTGTGKTTLLRTVNGLVPHATGGTLRGRVTVGGRDTRTHPPRDLADLVGVVGQDPLAGMVTDVVEEELAYGMESLAIAPDVMRRRVEETLDLLGLVHLRHRPIRSLSGGERQRVAIGAVLAVGPRVLVLDEPTSALDPPAAEEVLAALHRLVHDLGMTVLLAEHRLERVVQFADRVVLLRPGGHPPLIGDPATVLAAAPVAPPVVELGRIGGWSPLPLTVRQARRQAGPLREQLADLRPHRDPAGAGPTLAAARDLVVRYGPTVALRGTSLELRAGETVALMGRNGAGKSSLLSAFTGTVRPAAGQVTVGGLDPAELSGPALISQVGLVPQQPADLLYAPTIAEECAAADDDAGVPGGSCRRLLDRLVPGLDDDHHPRDLSEGQRLALVLAIVLTAAPPVLLLDEPTRGLDLGAKVRLVEILDELTADGRAILLATHDVELVAEVATRTIVLADGEVVADGPTEEVVVGSPAFAPQVSKVLGPGPWLTVSEVADALDVLP